MLSRLALAALLTLALHAGCEPRRAAESAEAPLRPGEPTMPVVGATEGATPEAAPAAPAQAATRVEDFDSGHKPAYASGEVTLATGPWLLDEALLGTADQDRKRGRAALRLKPDGRARMLADVAGPVATVTVRHAAYGQDAPAPWQLFVSANGGKSWQQVGPTQTAARGRLQTATFLVNRPGPLRFELRHAGDAGRVNLDDVTLLTGADAVVVPTETTKPESPTPALPPARTPKAVAGRDDPLTLGNPSQARADEADLTNYLIRRPEYALSYNARRGTANWVSWHLSPAWKGGAPRSAAFTPDPLLPAAAYHVTTRDYVGSGFDRGHMCPAGDRNASPTENAATFELTNIVPQAPANNQGPWRELEDYARYLAAGGSELYIIAGPAGQGGAGLKGPATTLAGGRITVPQWTWKILVVLPQGAADLGRVTVATRVIAIQMPNDQSVEGHHWGEYRVSVAQLEKLTGYNFLSALPKPVQQALEKKPDTGPVR